MRAHETLRTCVGCRRIVDPAALMRLVVDGDRIVASRTAAGRGAWLCPGRACLEQAVRTRALPRALRHAGPLDLSGLEAQFERCNG